MNRFRNKHFKNELDPKYALYDCRRSCELKSKSTSENSLAEFIDHCEIRELLINFNK